MRQHCQRSTQRLRSVDGTKRLSEPRPVNEQYAVCAGLAADPVSAMCGMRRRETVEELTDDVCGHKRHVAGQDDDKRFTDVPQASPDGGDRTSAGWILSHLHDLARTVTGPNGTDQDSTRGRANSLQGPVEQSSATYHKVGLVHAAESSPLPTRKDYGGIGTPLVGHLSIFAQLADCCVVLAAAAQFAATTDKAANLERITELVHAAAQRGADVVVVPEAAMHDFGPPDMPLGPVAETLDGPFVSAIRELATQHSVTLIAGMFESSDEPSLPYNTVVAVDPAGEVVARYRKAHLYDSFGYRESDRLSRVSVEPTVLPVGEFNIGVVTCYDLRFPEFTRALIERGADVLAVPSAWVRGPLKEDHWATLLRARAIENTAYIVGAGQTGKTYVGCSMHVDPLGVVVASLGDEEGVVLGELSPSRLRVARERNPSLANRRMKPAVMET